jgi:ABC-type Zn uptake system ZnuABC Zn-binding protein ZnuA
VALLEVQGRSVEARSGHAHGAANPHYWLDPANAEPMSAAIAEALVRLVPERRREIEAAQARFVADLRVRLDAWTARLAPHRGAALVAYHNSWPYLARAFGLVVQEFLEPKPGIPPSPSHIASVIQTMRRSGVKIILVEPYFSRKVPDLVAARTEATVVELLPSVGGKREVDTYFDLFDYNVQKLIEAARTSGAVAAAALPRGGRSTR